MFIYLLFTYVQKEGSKKRMERRKKQIEKQSSKTIKRTISKDTVGLMVRLHDGKNLTGALKAELRELKLNQKYDAQFINLNEENISKFAYGYVVYLLTYSPYCFIIHNYVHMLCLYIVFHCLANHIQFYLFIYLCIIGRLKPLDDYVLYGFVSKRSVIELVHRRAFTTIKGSREPLSDNLIVEKVLGEKGILCLNDLSDEVYSIGEHFDDAISILCTFKLSAPLGSYEARVLNVSNVLEKKGGFVGDEMDAFLEKIL